MYVLHAYPDTCICTCTSTLPALPARTAHGARRKALIRTKQATTGMCDG